MLEHAVRVPRSALLHAWSLEGLGGPHPVLTSSGLFVPEHRAAELTRQCLRLLADVGLSTGRTLTPDFREVLRTLARPSREVYGWSSHADPERDSALVVVERDGEAVAATVRGDEVTLHPVDARRLVDEFVAMLPAFPAATVTPLRVPRADVDAVGDGRRRADRRDVEDFHRRLTWAREAAHQLYGAVTVDGVRRRSRPLTLVDVSELGRMLLFVDTDEHVHRRPGTPAAVSDALLATLRGL
ncbi:ESX secretion-associated protein EspG [Saccharomonospora azurea]|uniref:ESX secretion-associated protein EspG n=1 Tax=Saccharomonospora azurea TaxID=40988 RepID=UPI000680BDDA|nr:ESX secretion-associated protein EspG [Saccharomonospora azurea]